MNSSPIIVATTANDNYFHGLCVTILSAIIATDPSYPLSFRVFDTGLAEGRKNILRKLCLNLRSSVDVEFISITADRFEGLTADYGGGYSTYARLLMGSLVQEDKLIYVDSDFLVLKDLSEAWLHPMNGNVMLATPDSDTPDGSFSNLSMDCPFAPSGEVSSFTYFTCGFLLVDLEAWRKQDVEKNAFLQMKGFEDRLKAWDQTILNYTLRGKIGAINPSWSWSYTIGEVIEGRNIHYIAKCKPWNAWSFVPAFRLWYIFHQIFVSPQIQLEIPFKVKVAWTIRHLRDRIMIICPALSRFHVKSLKRRKGEHIGTLYEASLVRGRKLLANKKWKSTACINYLESHWRNFKPSFEGINADDR